MFPLPSVRMMISLACSTSDRYRSSLSRSASWACSRSAISYSKSLFDWVIRCWFRNVLNRNRSNRKAAKAANTYAMTRLFME